MNSFQKPYSEATGQLIDSEVMRLIKEAQARALNALKDNRKKLEELTEILLQKEVVYKNELEALLGKPELASGNTDEYHVLK